MSRKGQIRHAGLVWKLGGEGHVAQYNDRITLMTWEFGDIHQCKLFIKYNGAKREEVGIGLEYETTIRRAMEKLARWGKKYEKRRPLTPEKFIQKQIKDWPTLFKDRLDVIDYTFFTIGNGFDWLDGEVVDCGPEAVSNHKDEEEDLFDQRFVRSLKEAGISDKDIKELMERAEEQEKERLAKLPPKTHRFYPVSEDYSLVSIVPDDVLPGWLDFAYEAAVLLRDSPCSKKHLNPGNAKLGRKIVKDLEKRFGERLRKAS